MTAAYWLFYGAMWTLLVTSLAISFRARRLHTRATVAFDTEDPTPYSWTVGCATRDRARWLVTISLRFIMAGIITAVITIALGIWKAMTS
ncbi:MAG: hypothetical protein M0R06_19615 [Sphaerochaeta sp.]|jgi:hypothetical protein|nr:hypothetical protein [Sphaerochaeta sp.]